MKPVSAIFLSVLCGSVLRASEGQQIGQTRSSATPSASSSTSSPSSGSWPCFRGSHNGVADNVSLGEASKVDISEKWKSPTPTGFSSFAIEAGKAFTLITREQAGANVETLLALDAATGKELWAKPLVAARYDGGGDAGTRDNRGGDGPRSTPTVDGGKVYVIDGTLMVWCFDANDGHEIWKHDVLQENAGVNIAWQDAASPVIDGNLLLMAGGGKGQALMGLDKNTGAVKWKGEDDKMTHATPILTELLGVHQCIFLTQIGLVSVDPPTGAVIWRAPFKYSTSTAASPVVFEDIVYCSAGYNVGAGAFKLSKNADGKFVAGPIWRKDGNELANHWSTPVVKDGYLYGMFSFKKFGLGPLACVDIRTGEVKWRQAGFGPGQLILSAGTLIALTDKGEVVFAAADPAKYQELKRQQLVSGKIWSYPAIANGCLYARSTVEGGCWQLK